MHRACSHVLRNPDSNKALTDGNVVPLGDVLHVLPLPPGLRYPVNDDEKLLTNTFVSREVSSSPGSPASTEPLADSSADDGDEWRRAAYEYGPKWVVWKGRLPGILDSWYETASIVV